MKERKTSRLGAALVLSVVAVALLSAPPAHGHDDSEYCCELCVERYAGAYADLHGRGHWSWVPDVGAHVWFPYVETSWRPFSRGQWIRTRHGITWVSHDPWGAIPYHYGHWIFVDRAGWGWIPGHEYSPAPVSWVVVDGYVGWAPLPPPGYRYPHRLRRHFAFQVGGGGWSAAYGWHASDLDLSFWVFVADDDFYGRPVHRHVLPARNWPSLVKGKKIRSAGSRLDADTVRKLEKRGRSGETVREERAKRRSVDPRERDEKSRPSLVAKKKSGSTTARRELASASPAPAKKKRSSTSGTAERTGDGKRKRRAR